MVGRTFVRTILVAFTLVVASGTSARAQRMAAGNRAEQAPAALVSIEAVDRPLIGVLDGIARQAGLRTSWNDAVFNSRSRVTLKVHDVAADVAFAKALTGTGLRAVISSSFVSIVKDAEPQAVVDGIVIGTVTDAKTKQRLRGATIVLDESNNGAMSGDDGTFRINRVSPGPHTLRVRMLGYMKTARAVTVSEGQSVTIDIPLEVSVAALDQVVVTGTVVQTAQREIPSAMTVITRKELEDRGITRIDQLFRGDVPGVFVQSASSDNPLDKVTMYARGGTALSTASQGTASNTNAIKTYVDGVELADPSYLSQIDASSIERIEILTGPQASTIYGSNAINGVMQIFTKRGSGRKSPQITGALQSGWIENSFSPSRTPQHDAQLQVNGTDQFMSYNVGGSWQYVGPWTPAKQTSRTNGFGGLRLQQGPITADASARLARTLNHQRGSTSQTVTDYRESGWYSPFNYNGASPPTTFTLSGQTFGLTLGYAPTSWWTHELVLGQDKTGTESRYTRAGYMTASDTLLYLNQVNTARTSWRYATTLQGRLTDWAKGVITLGGDGWESQSTSLTVTPSALTGTLNGTPTLGRQPGRNAGGFVQGQLGLSDALFLTYGVRAEWNPGFGEDAQPNLSPRYGVSYARDVGTSLGTMTAKLRASYGRATRPPVPGYRDEQTFLDRSLSVLLPYYGNQVYARANPELGPETQHGGEGGLELYFGSRASLVVTRYNQIVDNLIAQTTVDSVRSLNPGVASGLFTSQDAAGYAFYPTYQYLNVGSIRNQGWESQGTLNFGPITTRGTYSWTKSRVIGVTPRYRSVLTTAVYQAGASFVFVPEHTWAIGATYSAARTTLALNVNGVGRLRTGGNASFYKNVFSLIRLSNNRLRMASTGWNQSNPGYALVDLNLTQRFTSHVDGLLQIQNLADHYQSDIMAGNATIGRQTKFGVRIR